MRFPNYKTVRKVIMSLFTVIAIIDVILIKDGSDSLYNAMAPTMGAYKEQFLYYTKILFWAGVILFPFTLAFDVLDKKKAGKPFIKTLVKNISFGLFILIPVLYFYLTDKLFL